MNTEASSEPNFDIFAEATSGYDEMMLPQRHIGRLAYDEHQRVKFCKCKWQWKALFCSLDVTCRKIAERVKANRSKCIFLQGFGKWLKAKGLPEVTDWHSADVPCGICIKVELTTCH